MKQFTNQKAYLLSEERTSCGCGVSSLATGAWLVVSGVVSGDGGAAGVFASRAGVCSWFVVVACGVGDGVVSGRGVSAGASSSW